MNNKFRFWIGWTSGQQRMLTFASVALLISLGWFAWSDLSWPAPALKWEYDLAEEAVEVPVESVTIGPYQLSVKADSFLLWSTTEATGIRLPKWPWYLFTGLFTSMVIVALSLHSTLNRWWFYGLGGLIPVLVSLMRPESFGLPIPYPWPTVILSLIWMGPGLYFHLTSGSATLGLRMMATGGAVLLSLSALLWLATEPEPILLLSIGYLPAALLAFLVFLILSGHEIVAAVVRMLGGSGSRHTLRDFLVLTLIYLANLMATYFGNRGWFDWDFPIHPLLLLAVSGILGFWGTRNAHQQSPGVFGHESHAIFYKAALFIASFSAIGLMYATANDAVITTARNLSLYVHISFGLMFVPFVLVNFGELIMKNMQVGKVLYQPMVFGMTYFRLSGLLAASVFIFYHIWSRPINDLRGGYYNAIGDYYRITGQQRFSDAYLEMGRSYAFHNQHSNYLLAERALEDRQIKRAVMLFDDAAERRPMAEAYVNVSRLLLAQDRLLDAYARLETALGRLPGNEHLHNAMGITELRMNAPDSALLNFSLAGKISGPINTAAALNRIQSHRPQVFKVDSLLNAYPDAPDAFLSNLMVLGKTQGSSTDLQIIWPSDTTLTLAAATLLNNYVISHVDSLPEEKIEKIMALAKRPSNSGYDESLHFALAHAAFQNGMPGTAFHLMDRVIIFSDAKGRYNNQLAVWAMKLGAAKEAVKFSQLALNQQYPDAGMTHAIALAESGAIDASIREWETLTQDSRPAIHQLAESSLRFLSATSPAAENLSDVERYAWCRYHPEQLDSAGFRKALGLIVNGDLRVRAIIDRATWQFQRGRDQDAIMTYQMVKGMPVVSESLYHQLQLFELRLLASAGDMETLALQLSPSSGFRFETEEQTEQKYFQALLQTNDTSKSGQNYDWIAKHNLWFEDGVIRAAESLKDKRSDFFPSLQLLAKALHLNPYAIRVRMEYIRECYRLRQYDFADRAMPELQKLLTKDEWMTFMSNLPPRTFE